MELLTEKYRPKTIEDLVITNKEFGDKLKQWKEKGSFDSHILLYGIPGTGKSSSINVILNELNITDYITINGSDKTGIDDTRRIIEYASVPSLDDKIKVVVLEEFERLSPQAQDSLKYVLEKYSSWCRFIFTTNNVNKVTPAILSRCESYSFQKLDQQQFVTRIVNILTKENIKYSMEDVVEYIKLSYPDLRKCINDINKNVINGELCKFNKEDEVSNLDKLLPILDFVHNRKHCNDVQKLIATSFNEDEIENIYKIIYNKLDVFTVDRNKWEMIVVKVADYLYKHPTVAFKDLNLMACLVELKNIING